MGKPAERTRAPFRLNLTLAGTVPAGPEAENIPTAAAAGVRKVKAEAARTAEAAVDIPVAGIGPV
jgi:hypothetical protein